MTNIQDLGETTQRPDEVIAYTVDVSNNGSSPTVSAVTIIDKSDPSTDLSETNLSGSASVSGDVITTPLVTGLSDNTTYRVEVKYTLSGETYEDFFEIFCTDDI